MADQQEEDDLQMALRMSMQHSPPEPKRSRPRESASVGDQSMFCSGDSKEGNNRLSQRELMAAAAEKRLLAAKSAYPSASASTDKPTDISVEILMEEKESVGGDRISGKELSQEEASQLFSMVFGTGVSSGILAQWSNQGIRFSPDPETSMGLVQHEGGPCGVLATIQAFVLKYLLFFPDELDKPNTRHQSTTLRLHKRPYVASNNFSSLTADAKKRSLVKSMGEILFLCGNNERACVVTLSALDQYIEESDNSPKEETIAKALEGLSVESASVFQKILRVETYTDQASGLKRLDTLIPIFQSRMGAMLFLISALLSRGLDSVQADRDDPGLPLVTAPFGHASQEIVNLLLCGQAVPNVFDGRMDLGGGMFLKGVSTSVEVGFLTLLESLNFCKVGQHLKCPNWPIWVVGSDSHYTVIFALDTSVQEENELEARESQIRRAFDAHDQSGGGGFISVEGFHQVLQETNVRLPPEKIDNLSNTGFIVWSEFWQVILDLDKTFGGLKDSTGLMGKKVFDLYHFNGIAKSNLNGSQSVTFGGEIQVPRPRLTKLKVSVPPRWTPEEFMSDVPIISSSSVSNESGKNESEVGKPEASQHAPLVDCIKTRWPRAVCNWVGDPPSIV